MIKRFMRRTVAVLVSATLALGMVSLYAQAANTRPVFGVFTGTTPADPPVRTLLRIPPDAEAEIVEWKLTFYRDPLRYDLQLRFGMTAPNRPGLARAIKTLERQGTWSTTTGTKSDAQAVVYALDGAGAFLEVDANVLHVLNADRSLMVGNGGWSYTINRVDRAEAVVDASAASTVPDMGSYSLSPRAAGPSVLGIFEGRTPCQGITHELGIVVHPGCAKLKWRVTLLRDPRTLEPTRYKVEGTLTRSGAREGVWTIARGTPTNPNAVVYRLQSTANEEVLSFVKGDDNVLFFLSRNRRPMVGNGDFSYTLDRRGNN